MKESWGLHRAENDMGEGERNHRRACMEQYCVYMCVCAYVFSTGNRLLTGMLTNPNKIKYNKS